MIRLETGAVDLMEERISELKEAVNLFMKFLLIYKRHIFLIYENVKGASLGALDLAWPRIGYISKHNSQNRSTDFGKRLSEDQI